MRAHALLTLWTKWRRESVLAGIKAPVRQCAGKGAPWPARAVAPSSPHLAAYTHLTSASWLNIKSFQHRVGEPRPLLLKIIEIHWKPIWNTNTFKADRLYRTGCGFTSKCCKEFNLIDKIEIEKKMISFSTLNDRKYLDITAKYSSLSFGNTKI